MLTVCFRYENMTEEVFNNGHQHVQLRDGDISDDQDSILEI